MSHESQFPGRYLILWAVSVGYASVMLAVVPLSVALPTIAADMHADVAVASWIMTAYLLALTACLLPAGRIGDVVGYKPVFLAGAALTTAASSAVALSDELAVIVALRACQGVGAALISGTTLAILTATFRESERGRVVGVATVAAALGAGAGTILAPMALDLAGWRGVFWLVPPVGLVSLLLTLRMATPPQPIRTDRSVDVPGTLLLVGALMALTLSFSHLHEGEESFAAGWRFHTSAQVAAVVLFLAFLFVERRSKTPLVQVEHFRRVPFTTSVAANAIYHMTMMAMFFLTPLLFEGAWSLGPGHTSVALSALQVVNLAFAILGGWIVDRTRWGGLAPLSLGIIAGGMLALGLLVEHLSYEAYVATTVLIGVGSGLFNTANNTAIMSSLPAEARGLASGMLETGRQFGHTVAVSLGAVAMTAAGAAAAGNGAAIVGGFQVAEIAMGLVAAAGIVLAAGGRLPRRPSLPPLSAQPMPRAAVSVSAAAVEDGA